MTADLQLAGLQAWLDTHPAPWTNDPNATARIVADEDTLIRGHLSRSARKAQRSGGPYFPAIDDQGIDRDGWEHGARYGGRS